MRFGYVFLVAVASLLAGSNALSVTTSAEVLRSSTDNQQGGKRFLRTTEEVDETLESSERRLQGVTSAIKEATQTVKESTLWKLQFAMWKKVMGKTPQQVANKLKVTDAAITKAGGNMISHANWDKLKAYQKYYGKGPLSYP